MANTDIVNKQVESHTPPRIADLNQQDIEGIFSDAAKKYGYNSVDELLDAYNKLRANETLDATSNNAIQSAVNTYDKVQGRINEMNKPIERNEDGTLKPRVTGVDNTYPDPDKVHDPWLMQNSDEFDNELKRTKNRLDTENREKMAEGIRTQLGKNRYTNNNL